MLWHTISELSGARCQDTQNCDWQVGMHETPYPALPFALRARSRPLFRAPSTSNTCQMGMHMIAQTKKQRETRSNIITSIVFFLNFTHFDDRSETPFCFPHGPRFFPSFFSLGWQKTRENVMGLFPDVPMDTPFLALTHLAFPSLFRMGHGLDVEYCHSTLFQLSLSYALVHTHASSHVLLMH
jgi:hypothetical protein